MVTGTPRLPIRVGVIGAGFIGPAHIESLRRLGFVEIVALSCSSQETAARKAADLFVPRAYGDYLDLIADPEVDVVDIASPNATHYPAAKAALAAGKHVVCDKPLGMNSVESAEASWTRRSQPARARRALQRAVYPLIRHARALVQRGDTRNYLQRPWRLLAGVVAAGHRL